ncbi:DUF664 domain-containing protein [Chloroflexota bacterium]
MEAEVQGYLKELGILKEHIKEAIQSINAETANWCPLSKGTNSIYAIVYHLLGSEEYWVVQTIGGENVNRDREAEFRASGNPSMIMEHWEKQEGKSNNILSSLSLSQLGEDRISNLTSKSVSYTVRGCILHVISHYATHLGHIQLTQQLWEQR